MTTRNGISKRTDQLFERRMGGFIPCGHDESDVSRGNSRRFERRAYSPSDPVPNHRGSDARLRDRDDEFSLFAVREPYADGRRGRHALRRKPLAPFLSPAPQHRAPFGRFRADEKPVGFLPFSSIRLVGNAHMRSALLRLFVKGTMEPEKTQPNASDFFYQHAVHISPTYAAFSLSCDESPR